ncbi:MAG: PaaI family thioesterase [Myxococcota bacterium]|nr:PaaI family thioesterase [Myxococcota bacterium]
MEEIRKWVENSPYTRALGFELTQIDSDSARLFLPFQDKNANPGRALHGGCAASLAVVGGQCVTRAAMGAESGPWHAAAIQVNYLAAAVGEDVYAEARLLRQGKALCFVVVDAYTDAGKPIAQATTLVSALRGSQGPPGPDAERDDGHSDPGPLGPHVVKAPYMAARGIVIENMSAGKSRVTLPHQDVNLDASGGIHEGSLLALLDTAGAMAAWAETGPGAYKASTPSLQAQILSPPGAQDLIAYGRVQHRNESMFWCTVEVVGRNDLKVIARGTVVYRIVV